MRMPTFGTLDVIDEWIDTAQIVRLSLREGYVRRTMLDHGVSLDRMCLRIGDGCDVLTVDGVEVARIELRWEGYVGSWWHGWTGDWMAQAPSGLAALT